MSVSEPQTWSSEKEKQDKDLSVHHACVSVAGYRLKSCSLLSCLASYLFVYVGIFDTCSSLLPPGPAGCNGSSLSCGWPSQQSLDPSVQQLWHSHHKTNAECKGCCYPNKKLYHQPLFQMWFSVGKSLCLGIWIWP